MPEHVILFAGEMGAGKTTAVRTLSEIEVVSTEEANSERFLVDKETTTVALDYGEITLDDDKVRLYGLPGQRRFDFMWGMLQDRAQGLVLLVNNAGPDPVAAVVQMIESFSELAQANRFVIGISHSDLSDSLTLADYSAAITAAHPGLVPPIFRVDPRDSNQMQTLLLTLIAIVEARNHSEKISS